MLGNKCDSYRKIVDYETGMRFADDNRMHFLEVSAKNGSNISTAFSLMTELILRKRPEEESTDVILPVGTSSPHYPENKPNFKCCTIS